MAKEPAWWRGWPPSDADLVHGPTALTGKVTQAIIDAAEADPDDGLRRISPQLASLEGLHLDLSDVSWWGAWSQVVDCRFTSRIRPVSNKQGHAGHGYLGWRPTLFHDCVFERVRFKTYARPGPPGFSLGYGTYENCQFIDCRWNGHFAHNADLINCTFVGKVDGCVWFGEGKRNKRIGAFASEQIRRRNVIVGNDFSRAQLTRNIGWRYDFPLEDQVFPDDFVPTLEPPLPPDLF